MLQAIDTHTRNPSDHAILINEHSGDASVHDASLRDICQKAAISFHAMLAVHDTAAELNIDSAGRDAVSRIIGCMQSDWQREIERVSEFSARGMAGIVDKARLLREILELQADGQDEALPAISLAASLVTDLLRQPISRSP